MIMSVEAYEYFTKLLEKTIRQATKRGSGQQMNDEEFGRLAMLLVRTEGIESDAVGTILWQIYEDFKDEKTGDWK